MNLLQALLPQSCFLCGDACTDLLCRACQEDLPRQRHVCSVCACVLPKEVMICAQCLREKPHFTSVQAALAYAYPVDKLIHAAKYQENLTVLHYLSTVMAAHFRQHPRPDLLLPVPLHPRDLRARGFNQAVELGKVVSRMCGIPLERHLSRCVRHKRKQAQLSAAERKINVRNAFAVDQLPAHCRHLVLLDDVVTTGATVNELARMCLNAGAQRVDVWCCARNQWDDFSL